MYRMNLLADAQKWAGGGRQSRRMPFLDRQSVFGADLTVALAVRGYKKVPLAGFGTASRGICGGWYRAGMAPIKQYHF